LPPEAATTPARGVAGQEIGERAARLERAGMLKQLKLDREGMPGQAELGAIDLDHRRPPDEGPNESLALGDPFRSYGIHRCSHQGTPCQLTIISYLAN